MAAGEAEVRKNLGHVNALEAITSLDLYYDRALNEKVNPVRAGDLATVKSERQRLLTLYCDASFQESDNEAFLVARLQEPGPQFFVNRKSTINDYLGQLVQVCFHGAVRMQDPEHTSMIRILRNFLPGGDND